MDWFLASNSPPKEEIFYRPLGKQGGVKWDKEAPRFASWLYSNLNRKLGWTIVWTFSRMLCAGHIQVSDKQRQEEIAKICQMLRRFYRDTAKKGEEEAKPIPFSLHNVKPIPQSYSEWTKLMQKLMVQDGKIELPLPKKLRGKFNAFTPPSKS